MTFTEIRDTFFEFFKSKQHKIVPSAPLLNKDDPTLMFINAGMNQFKDYFLGNGKPDNPRIADTQKCLRVSGKHNDLEDVGLDSYHHTLFEMLGNWSFGDYFKKEAIAWAWELLTEVYKIPKDRLYITIFEGSKEDGVEFDQEAHDYWKKWVPEDRILPFDKKDNFWEMGATGPCGPCSEIHVDMRPDAEREKLDGAKLVNMDDPNVIEIWNLVFIQFNRKADGSLEELPEKHIDTGMGFERLCRVLQHKDSTYDTDVFAHAFAKIQQASGLKYEGSFAPDAKKDIAMRVVADHIRAVAFAIADGAMPSNTGAGYVIRRILRRAVRYYYSFLGIKTPFLHSLVPVLAADFAQVFPELKAQEAFVAKVIQEEEKSFLRTLATGLRRMENLEVKNNIIDGKTAFELFDTYGFPIDLTRLIAAEKGYTIDEKGFEKELLAQKTRSRDDAKREVGDWTVLSDNPKVQFLGYDTLSVEDAKVVKYRTVMVKDKPQYQIVLDKTPFYAEGGGQVGDKGILQFDGETIQVYDTKKENDLIIHYVDKLPQNPRASVFAQVNKEIRTHTANNHSATHLMHAALRQVLGTHVRQKGSLVNDKYLRFDFSHFQKVTEEELAQVEHIVNQKIRENIALGEARDIPIAEAQEAGALMLFGEKYGERVRMITFDETYSRELCGGIHVPATGQLGFFKIISESAIAAGVRRVEAVTGPAAEDFIQAQINELNAVKAQFKNAKEPAKRVAALVEENKNLSRQVDTLLAASAKNQAKELAGSFVEADGMNVLIAQVDVSDAKALKTMAFDLEKSQENAFIGLGANIGGKPQLLIVIAKPLVEAKGLHAGNLIREIAKAIKGGGGGQPFFATAGGSDASGISAGLNLLRKKIGLSA
ncbi:MAG TPA: alanine--tRNA ligase [Saprospiraceae bacterium]|nr:alanine--tRNA ligase [Saprospiraceae bacterium]